MSARTPYPWEYTGSVLEIETPEHTRVELRIAPYGARMVGALVDYMIVYGCALVLMVVLLLTLGASFASGLDGNFGILLAVGIWVVFDLGYFTWSELRGQGRTIGKRVMSLRSVGPAGEGLTFGGALLRNLARVVDIIPLFWVVPMLTTGQRRIGDLIAGTYVIHEEKERDGSPGRWINQLAPSYQELEQKLFPFPSPARAKLKQADLDLIEYLEDQIVNTQRRDQRKLFRETARRYVKRLGLEDQAEAVEGDPERFLQELGLLLRERFDAPVF